jgi:hypothetical protein
MTAHANASRWKSGVLAGFCPEMTVKTGNLQLTGVLLMGKGDRLFGFIPFLIAWQMILRRLASQYQ